ncbi:MAG: glycosyltransferase [Nitrospirae bacterium]|nr:glycosyltransferase [Nitrospirota bacterium]
MKIAVVIPIKNEIDGLEELVQSLLSQTLQPDEVIFVDAGSTDGSVELLQSRYRDNPVVRLIQSAEALPGRGRNVGVMSTDADIIAQIDGGNLPDAKWLELLCAPIIRGEAEYSIGGLRFMPIPKKILGIEIDLAQVYGASMFPTIMEKKYIGGGACVAYKRDVWQMVGGFPEELRVAEDMLFVTKALRLNAKTTFVRNAWIYWQIGPTLADIVKRQIEYQKAKFRESESVFRYKATIILPAVLAITTVISSAYPPLLYIVPVVVLAYWFRKTFKSMRIFLRRSPAAPSVVKRIIIFGAVLAVEFLHMTSRLIGTVRGLTRLEDRKIFLRVRDSYLFGANGRK